MAAQPAPCRAPGHGCYNLSVASARALSALLGPSVDGARAAQVKLALLAVGPRFPSLALLKDGFKDLAYPIAKQVRSWRASGDAEVSALATFLDARWYEHAFAECAWDNHREESLLAGEDPLDYYGVEQWFRINEREGCPFALMEGAWDEDASLYKHCRLMQLAESLPFAAGQAAQRVGPEAGPAHPSALSALLTVPRALPATRTPHFSPAAHCSPLAAGGPAPMPRTASSAALEESSAANTQPVAMYLS